MPRLKYTEGDRIGWLCCLDCGTRWVGGIGHEFQSIFEKRLGDMP